MGRNSKRSESIVHGQRLAQALSLLHMKRNSQVNGRTLEWANSLLKEASQSPIEHLSELHDRDWAILGIVIEAAGGGHVPIQLAPEQGHVKAEAVRKNNLNNCFKVSQGG